MAAARTMATAQMSVSDQAAALSAGMSIMVISGMMIYSEGTFVCWTRHATRLSHPPKSECSFFLYVAPTGLGAFAQVATRLMTPRARGAKPVAPPGRIEGDETLRQRAGDHTVRKGIVDPARLDAESAEWLQELTGTGPRREAALTRLHERLLRIARREAARRAPRLTISGPELDDVAHQATADALLAITAKIGQFRGESRFITWAYKFVIFEVSAKIGRHFWQHRVVPLDAEDWDRLPVGSGFDPAHQAEWRDLLAALHRAVDTELTPRQREVFVALVLNDVPLDTLVLSLASNRNAIYKMMFDARRKLRAALAANGYLPDDSSRRS
jgi:RNA polymerase sigma-70 factor, ECF subfamily